MGTDTQRLYALALDRDHARVPAALPRLLCVRRRSPRRRPHACASCATSRVRRSSTACWRSWNAIAPCTCRLSAANHSSATANSTRCCRSWPLAASTRNSSRAPCARFRSDGAACGGSQIVVSIDGLQPEHDARRTPATYDRILKHIAGHQITVHCTVTRQQVEPAGLHRRVPALLVRPARRETDLDEPVHAADRRDLRRAADGPPTASA